MAFRPISFTLLDAVRNDDIGLLTKLFKQLVSAEVRDELHNTPLNLAVQNNQLSATKLLLEYGADVNTYNSVLVRPIHYAAINNNRNIMLLLIEYGAKLDYKTKEGRLPIEHTRANTTTYKILFDAERGRLREQFEEVDEVPVIPEFCIPTPKVKSEGKGKKGKKGAKKKGGKKKKKK